MPTINHLTADACAEIAERGAAAVAALRGHGIAIRPRHGLLGALDTLRAAARAQTLGYDPETWARTAGAVQLVAAWVEVVQALPPDLSPEIRAELRGALEGTSAADPSTNVLSQLWLGQLLARVGGVSIAIPTGDRARPDFTLRVGEHVIGVEVKRPATPRSAEACVKDGAGQLRDYGTPGLVALDLATALGAHALTRESYAGKTRAADLLRPSFGELTQSLARYVDRHQRDEQTSATRATQPGRFGAVCGLLCYARVYEWTPGTPQTPVFMHTVSMALFSAACTTDMLATLRDVRERLRMVAEARAPHPDRSLRWRWTDPAT